MAGTDPNPPYTNRRIQFCHATLLIIRIQSKITVTAEVKAMKEAKLDVVREYLKNAFPEATIDEKYDFDRDAQTFRIRLGTDLLLLKVGRNFLSDNNEAEVQTHFENWEVAKLLQANKEFGIFVGNNPPVAFGRYI